jgi:putative ABC transport system permease protein
MRRATLRSLLAHKLRLALSAVAIVLGVAFVAGTMIFTDTLDRTFTSLFQSTASDVSVEAAAGFRAGGDAPAGTRPVPPTLVDRVRDVDGVAAAEGYVQAEGVYLLTPSGQVLDTGGAPGVGVSWTTERALSASELTDGRAPQRAGEVALDSGSAEEAGFAVGDRVTVLTPGPRVEATVVGIFTFGEDGGLAGASLTAFDVATAQQLLGVGEGFTGIQVLAADDVPDAELADRVAAAVGDDYDVRTARQQADERSAALADGLSFITVLLTAFAVIALFVGSFIILNTFSMLVAQRTRELALLRALGASRGQVTRSVLVEAGVLGVVGATFGLAGGFGIATGLRALFGSFGLTLDGDLVLSAGTVVWSYVVGVLVTVLAAWVPARRAARTPPVAALREDHVAVERSLRRRAVAGGVLAAVATAALAASVPADGGGNAASLVGVGALTLVLAAVALSPVLARPFARLFGAGLPRMAGTAGRLARDNAQRNPRRTAATASALMIGLTLVTGFGILGASANASGGRRAAAGRRGGGGPAGAVHPAAAGRAAAVRRRGGRRDAGPRADPGPPVRRQSGAGRTGCAGRRADGRGPGLGAGGHRRGRLGRRPAGRAHGRRGLRREPGGRPGGGVAGDRCGARRAGPGPLRLRRARRRGRRGAGAGGGRVGGRGLPRGEPQGPGRVRR